MLIFLRKMGRAALLVIQYFKANFVSILNLQQVYKELFWLYYDLMWKKNKTLMNYNLMTRGPRAYLLLLLLLL